MSPDLADGIAELAQRVKDNATRVVRDEASADDEAIHDYRVSLRRLRTMLRPLRLLYGKKKVRAVEAELKRFADRTGELREEEVLAETLAELPLSTATKRAVTTWLNARARRLASKRRSVRRELASRRTPPALATGNGKAPRTTGGYLETVLAATTTLLGGGPRRDHPPEELARRALGEAIAEVRAYAAEADPEDVAEMHMLRIRFKRMRYTAELLGPSLGLPASIAKRAAKMQKVLGRLHDLDDALRVVTATRLLSIAHRDAVRSALAAARRTTASAAVRDLSRELAAIERELSPPAD